MTPHESSGRESGHGSGPDGGRAARAPQDRLADHAAIDRLADGLLPALVAKLGASGLGELEVREGAWHVRLRMPGDGRTARRGAPAGPARPVRQEHRSEGHARTDAHGVAGGSRGASGSGGPLDADPTGATGGLATSDAAPDRLEGERPHRTVAMSPAVGFFRPRPDLPIGSRVRAGDRVGLVDVLGIGQDVLAPADGILGATLVQPGEPVEYGQEIAEIELLGAPRPDQAPDAEAGA